MWWAERRSNIPKNEVETVTGTDTKEYKRYQNTKLDKQRAEACQRVYFVFFKEGYLLPSKRLFIVFMLLLNKLDIALHRGHTHLRAYRGGKHRVQNQAHNQRERNNSESCIALRHHADQRDKNIIDRLY